MIDKDEPCVTCGHTNEWHTLFGGRKRLCFMPLGMIEVCECKAYKPASWWARLTRKARRNDGE